MNKRQDEDHYLPTEAYDRILDELAAVLANQDLPRAVDPQTLGIEILGLAGIWPDSVKADLEPTPENTPAS